MAAATARSLRPARNPGLTLVLAASGLYVAVSIWHFLEHASGADPEVAHVVIGVTKVAILAGVVWATVVWRRAVASRGATLWRADP